MPDPPLLLAAGLGTLLLITVVVIALTALVTIVARCLRRSRAAGTGQKQGRANTSP